ncbi:hypothetical protein [Alteribacillus sp. HJP-4]|uniref:hypothetical protein n=1 Tax=Alteribacillus sp. HJP-4 TaxID=2775394 RepID=UPI0035CD025B
MIRRNLIYIIAFLLFSTWLTFMDYIEHNSLNLLSNMMQSLIMVIIFWVAYWFLGVDKKSKESKTEN